MELSPIEILNGTLGWIYVIISILVGIKLISNYFKEKNNIYIYVGLTWIGLSTLWLAASISFLSAILTGNGLPEVPYFLIGVSSIPLTLFIWMTAFSKLIYEEYKRKIQIAFAIYGAIFEIVFLFFLFTDYSKIGVLKTPIDTDWGIFMQFYLIATIFIGVITGGLFAQKSMKSPNSEVKLRGKLIVMAFFTWAFGSIIDTIFEVPLIRALALIFLILSSFLFYFAFNLPKWMKKVLLKQS